MSRTLLGILSVPPFRPSSDFLEERVFFAVEVAFEAVDFAVSVAFEAVFFAADLAFVAVALDAAAVFLALDFALEAVAFRSGSGFCSRCFCDLLSFLSSLRSSADLFGDGGA
jgi:hypothetical protein